MAITKKTPPELLNKPTSTAICTLCGNVAHRKKDSSRGEYVCEKCGNILGMLMVTKTGEELSSRDEKATMSGPRGIAIPRKEFKKLSESQKFNRIWMLRKRYEPRSGSDGTEYRHRSSYYPFLKVLVGNYVMTHSQEQYVVDILYFLQLDLDGEGRGIKRLCGKCSYGTIILALCLHSQSRDKRYVDLEKDNFCKNLKLSYKRYNQIRDRLSGVEREAAKYYREHPMVEEVDLGGD